MQSTFKLLERMINNQHFLMIILNSKQLGVVTDFCKEFEYSQSVPNLVANEYTDFYVNNFEMVLFSFLQYNFIKKCKLLLFLSLLLFFYNK